MEVDPSKEIDIECTDDESDSEYDETKSDKGIDLESTDDESDSEYDETKSDKDFIIADGLSDVGDDRTYVPTDECLSSSEDDSTSEISEYYGDGSYGDDITILGRRYVMEGEEEKRQLLVRGWIDEGVIAGMTGTAI